MKTPHQTGTIRSRKKNKQLGQGLVEFSLILPMLLFILLGILDFGRILFIYSSAASAARDGARQATLVGTITDTQMGTVPRYMACANIDTLAGNFFGANRNTADSAINSIDILYFDTSDDGVTPLLRTLADIEIALDALDANDVTTLAGANFDCHDDASLVPEVVARNQNPDIAAGELISGDLMVILVDVDVDFITPFLDATFDSLAITFRAQRTLVESLVLDVSGTDRDGDGLLDEWELQRFGCVLENTDDQDDPVFLMTDLSLTINTDTGYTFLTGSYDNGVVGPPRVDPSDPTLIANSPEPGTATVNVDGYLIPSDCARENLSESIFDDPSEYTYLQCDAPDADTPVGTIENCIIVALDLFNALSDPDGDGCVNGCEEALGTSPYDYLNGIPGDDTDADGLTDTAEIGLGTDPLNNDTDGDGIWDGTERCELVSVDGLTCTTLSAADEDGNPNPYLNLWTNTNPLTDDTDNDGLRDDAEWNGTTAGGYATDPSDPDTDNDGINDGSEINGFVINLNINGVSFSVTGVITNASAATGFDTDGDGIGDGDEVFGYVISNSIETVTVWTHPNDADTDDDGMCDGDGTTGTGSQGTCSGIADINPTLSDTDSDGLNDYTEQVTYLTLADNNNTDGDVCIDLLGNPQSLLDGEEMEGTLATASGAGIDTDGDGLVNAADLDSDDGVDPTVTLSDCDEIFIYGTNPYSVDSDGDTAINPLWTDLFEIENIACLDPTFFNSAADFLACDDVSENVDTDGDGVPDAWEEIYYPGDLTNGGPGNGATSDNDLDSFGVLAPDNCDLVCEYTRGTNPLDPDTDNDGIRDGYETGSDPRRADTDGDGLNDGLEGRDPVTGLCPDPSNPDSPSPPRTCEYSNPRLADSDFDLLTDGDERNTYSTDPADPDSDDDGLSDYLEAVTGFNLSFQVRTATSGGLSVPYDPPTSGTINVKTDPNSPDSDNDGLLDINEVYGYFLDPRNPDTDGDGINDGTTLDSFGNLAALGENANDFDGSDGAYYTNAKLHDSDDDGLSDWQEIFPDLALSGVYAALNPYSITYTDITLAVVTVDRSPLGFDASNPFDTTRLSPLNDDVDSDGLEDGTEMLTTLTDPLDADSDDDAALDGDEVNDGDASTDPLRYEDNTNPDADGDGLNDVDEPGFDTDPTDADSDDDGLLDGFEFNGVALTYVIIEADGTVTTVNTTENIFGTATISSSPFGYSDGFDSDLDGIMDSFEIYWADQSNANIDTTAGFTSFAAAPSGSASCTYLTAGNLPLADFIAGQPLNPNLEDTDGDGLYDNYECENNLNPFDARDGTAIMDKILDNNLRTAVSLATSGDYAGAYAVLASSMRSDGRIELRIVRPNLAFVGDDAPEVACSDSHFSGITLTNVCGRWEQSNGTIGSTSTSEPNNNNGASDDDADLYLAPAAVFEFLLNDANASNNVISITIAP